jgi:hypothetical protein
MIALRSIVGSFLNPAAKKVTLLPLTDMQFFSSHNQKARTSAHEFAEVHYRMVSNSLTNEALEASARDFKFEIGSEEGLGKLHGELLFLNMWLTVHVCESELPSREKCKECLDLFHRLVYERHYPGQAKEGFREWLESMRSIYAVYDRAMNSGHPAAALWVVADVFSCNLFGKVRKDPLVQAYIGKYIEVGARHRRNAVKQHEVA